MKGKLRYWHRGIDTITHLREVPQDMLRYDNAFVSDDNEDMFVTIRTRDYTGAAAIGRWESFGIRGVHEFKRSQITPQLELSVLSKDALEKWYTYERGNAIDYIRVTLAEHCKKYKVVL